METLSRQSAILARQTRATASVNLRIGPSRIEGQGGFAACFLPKETRVVEYIGERITKAESLRRCEAQNWHIFGLDDEFDVDGNVDWNPARFLNHSCTPNCEAVCEEGHIWIAALRDIPAGEEITFNYGYDLIDYEEHPCHCGAPECAGYIVSEEFFERFRKR